jgi:hypothetical protein
MGLVMVPRKSENGGAEDEVYKDFNLEIVKL